MRRLLLLRHAKAAVASGGGDAERPLTERGQRDATRMGQYLAAEGLVPDTIVFSSARRTRETMEGVRHQLDSHPVLYMEPRLYLAEAQSLLDYLRRTPETTQVLLAIAHNPGLAELALLLGGESNRILQGQIRQRFPTCALAILDFACDWQHIKAGDGILRRFVVLPKVPKS
jgi:phosphohistidine phosphatase